MPRVVANISWNGTVDTSTAVYGVFDTNNIRSVATWDGTTFYIGGQGERGSTNQGAFVVNDGANTATGIDTSTDVRDVQVIDGMLYVSRDSGQGGDDGASSLGNYGTTVPVSTMTDEVVPGIAGTVMLSAAQTNTLNASAIGSDVNLSPEAYFFADATTLYVADSGNPKSGATLTSIQSGGVTQRFTFAGSALDGALALSSGANGEAEIALGSATAAPPVMVSSGTTVQNAVVMSGETLIVASGGALISAQVRSGGTVFVSGTDTGSVISAGGLETVVGSVSGDQVYGTQTLTVGGASASHETVHAGGTLVLTIKGTNASEIVVDGGALSIDGNASGTDITLTQGGVFDLQSPRAAALGTVMFVGSAR